MGDVYDLYDYVSVVIVDSQVEDSLLDVDVAYESLPYLSSIQYLWICEAQIAGVSPLTIPSCS